MSEQRFWKLGVGATLLLVVALILLAFLASRRTRTLGLGETLQFDDFFFTVESISPLNSLAGPQQPPAPADFNQVVRLRVENRAKRVPFTFNGNSLAFLDVTRKLPAAFPRAERSPAGALSAPGTHVLQAGETIHVDYVFALPPNHEDLRLRIMPGGPIGDLLEGMFFGRQEIQLP
jgi:hypothetical protein